MLSKGNIIKDVSVANFKKISATNSMSDAFMILSNPQRSKK